MNKKQLYETIMRNVSLEVKKALNEMSVIGKDNIDKMESVRKPTIKSLLGLIEEIYDLKRDVIDIIDTYRYMVNKDLDINNYLDEHVYLGDGKADIYTEVNGEIVMLTVKRDEDADGNDYTSEMYLSTLHPMLNGYFSKGWTRKSNNTFISFDESLDNFDFRNVKFVDIKFLIKQLNELIVTIHGCIRATNAE